MAKDKPTRKRGTRARGRKTSPRPAQRRRRGSWLTWPFRFLARLIWRLVWWFGLRIAVLGLLVVGGTTAYSYLTLPPAAELLDGRERGSVTLLDRDNRVFAWRGEQYVATRAETASPHLVNAVIATEDKRFHSHFGLDPKGIVRAMAANLRAGRVVQGGSTITQQVAKLLFFEHTRSLERPIRQVPIVLAMELKYSKNRDPVDLSQPCLSGRRRAGLRGGRTALFRQIRPRRRSGRSRDAGRAAEGPVPFRPDPRSVGRPEPRRGDSSA